MEGQRRKVSLGITDDVYDEGNHIIYLYNNDEERKRTMAHFLQQGLDADEKVLYLVHDITPDEMRRELCDVGVDAGKSQKAFDMMEAHYKHCPGEVFSPEYMLEIVGEYYESAMKDGYKGARGAGEMSWAAVEGRATLHDLINYETRLNHILKDHPLTTICQYDVRLFPGELIMDLLCVHSVAIVRGQIVKNPYYVPPDQFLEELNGRHANA